jgi:hypothetical protein
MYAEWVNVLAVHAKSLMMLLGCQGKLAAGGDVTLRTSPSSGQATTDL